MDLRKIFSVEFPIIAPVVVKPLPGSPGYAGDLERVIAAAVKDAKLLDEGGVDGLSFENLGDAPFFKNVAPPETIASLDLEGVAYSARSLPLEGAYVFCNQTNTTPTSGRRRWLPSPTPLQPSSRPAPAAPT